MGWHRGRAATTAIPGHLQAPQWCRGGGARTGGPPCVETGTMKGWMLSWRGTTSTTTTGSPTKRLSTTIGRRRRLPAITMAITRNSTKTRNTTKAAPLESIARRV